MTRASRALKVAIIDLYDNVPNEGMRCIREILTRVDGKFSGIPVTFKRFDTRATGEVPDLSYDLYISSGGPGSPFAGEGEAWERNYFDWLDKVWEHNRQGRGSKKFVFAICYSFQMITRYFEFATVAPRKSMSFGVMPVHKTPAGKREIIFSNLPNPFFAADFRDWQVIEPSNRKLQDLGAEVIALEKIRPHIDLERAIMGVRFSPEFVGVQFHPEADPQSMWVHFQKAERREEIIRLHGMEKYRLSLHRLQDASYLTPTQDAILPDFILSALEVLRPETIFSHSSS